MKGFISVLATASIFVVVIVLMASVYQQSQDVSYKEQFSEAKVFLSNYFVLMEEITQNCDWSATETEIQLCLNESSDEILLNMNSEQTNCIANSYTVSIMDQSAFAQISCKTIILNEGEIVFKNDFSKTITLRKNIENP